MKGQIPMKAIVLVIGVLVLALVVLYLYSSGALEKFGLLVPTLNPNKLPEGVEGIVGYNLQNGKLEFYDGIKWYELKESVEFDGKIITQESLRKDLLTNFFLRSSLREENRYTITDEAMKEIYPAYPYIVDERGVSKNLGSLAVCVAGVSVIGDVTMKLVDTISSEGRCSGEGTQSRGDVSVNVIGEVFVSKWNYDNQIVESEAERVSSGKFVNEINSITVRWKFSVLKKPAVVHYTEEGVEHALSVCVENSRNERLVVELADAGKESC